MRVLLELMTDVARLLEGMETLDQVRDESQPQIRALLESLHLESERLLNSRPDPQRREKHFQRALEAIAQERLDEAREILEAAIADFPDDSELHNHLGLVAWETGDFAAARDHYRMAVVTAFPADDADWFDTRHRPFLRAMEGQALAHYRLGENEEALALFESLADMNPAEYAGCRYGEFRPLSRQDHISYPLSLFHMR